jgi:hypothetical protein
MGKLGEEI